MGRTVQILTTIFCLMAIQSGRGEEQDSVNHLLLLDSLPEGFFTHNAIHFDIRTNFSGKVQLVESKDFMVVVNITAPSLQQAYDVNAQLFSYRSGVVLEVKEKRALPTVISVTWLIIGIGVATLFVFLCTAGYAIKWYKKESRGKYELPDHKSIASSSQRGNAYRAGNLIPMVPFAPGGRGDNLMQGDDTDHSRRCDEELRQVPELPEEEEAEALEMEQLTKQKLQEDMEMSGENEDSDPQERNLIKSRYHSQAKTVHKEMIKKAGSGKKSVSYKRTLNGVYKGLPTDQEETSNDENEFGELKNSGLETDFSFQDLQVILDGDKGMDEVNEKLNMNENSSEPAYANDPMLLVSADVHKDNPTKLEVVCITKDKPAKVGNIYVTPSELKPVMSTFGPGMTSTPKNALANTNAGDSGKQEGYLTSDNNFHNVPDKPRREVPWFTENLPVMGDILEDPHEDQQSIVSDSANSASMYGSSEIFDIQDPENTYYNLDSDFDIPPLDPEDILSDGGLPSPLGLPMYKLRTKGKANDDIKLIPGALKSPGPNANRLVQNPRPNSSIILSTGNTQSKKTPASSKSSDSPPLPPHPEVKGVSQMDTVFQFPPPPKMYNPPQNITWDKKVKSQEYGGEYVQIKQPKNQTNSSPQQTSSGPGGSALNTTYMNLTILSTLCILSLATGVYSAIDKSQTRVDIIIYTPKHLLNNTTRIFFNYHRETELVNNDNFMALVYDVSQPLLANKVNPFNKCWNVTCDHGCDEVTGFCICFKGFKLIASGECVDVNECMEGKAKCDKAAGCYNRKGSYDCICGEDFYGNGKKCRECKQECPEKHYEVQPCSPEIQKICKSCTQICRSGYYMAKPCSSHENAICRVCKPECLSGEYESRQCTNDHDRECKNVSLLELPETSKNVILEEKNHIKDDSAVLDKLPAHYVGFTRYKLNRGTGLYLDLTVRFIDAALQFVPVNMSQSMNFESLMPSVLKSYPVQRICPSPVPDYYILRYKKHEGLTYKQNDNGTIEDCETHRVYGEPNLPTTTNRQSFLCSQPGTLTNIFNMDDNFFLARTKWVDKSKRCQRYSQVCETCIRDCGTSMFSGDQTCNVGADDNDDGVSPRLTMCYNCCVKKNCSADCKDYHKRRCQPEQCLKGNLLEFTIVSSWDSSQDGRFFCHIAPVSHQLLLELEYVVKSTSSQNPLLTNTVKIYGDEAWEKTGFSRHNDGILDIMINSSLGTVPNILEGKTTQDSSLFKVGTYKFRGSKFGTSAISPMFVYLRPVTPHGIPPMPPAHQECTHTALNDMLLASNMEDPYIHNSKLEAVINHSYVVTNKDEQPEVKAVLSRHTAILSKLFSPTVLNISSFVANLVQNSSHWVITVSGRVVRCPGFLHIRLHGPIYPSEVVFDCDTVILCPKNFSMKFALPMSDRMGTAKDVIIEVKDAKNVHHFRIYRRTSIVEAVDEKEEASSTIQAMASPMKERDEPIKEHIIVQTEETSNLPLALPYLLAIGGIIVLLLVLAIIGLCFQPGLPKDTCAMWYHSIFAVVHMTFQFVYSVVVSGTIFFVILTIITNDNVNFLLQHGQSGGISLAPVHIELLHLQRHLESEISRQDSQADSMQKDCFKDVKQIVVDLKNLHQTVLQSTEDTFERHRLDLLLNQQKLHVRDKLSRDLRNFRNAYATSAKSVLRQVNQNAQASFLNVLHNNTWLVGTRFLYEAVQLLRKTHGKDGKTFMDWTGIKGDLAQLEIDLTFSLPALPRLDDLIDSSPDEPSVKRDAQEKVQLNEPIRSIQIHNNWFFPLEESSLTQTKLSQHSANSDNRPSLNETSYSFYIFLGLLVVCDLILLAHRMCKAWTSTKLIIFGFPEYVRKKKGEDEDEVFPPEDSNNKLAPVQSCQDSPIVNSLKMFLTQTISTTFFPKVVGSVAACFVLFCLLQLSYKYLTTKELGRMGLYQSNDQYLHLQMSMTNARLETHANYINTVDLPAFQATVHGYIARHRTVVEIYNQHLTGLQGLTIEMYCEHLKTIGVSGNCSETPKKRSKDMDYVEYFTPTCKFQPVVPQLFKRNTVSKIPLSERQLEALLENLRFIIYYTSQLTVIFLAIIVLKELTCAVLWILIQRSGVIHIRIIVEQDESL
ncbi:unnamed protein product [Lymnaea stagnalis]|uniref:TNFR-Cys domain-containing protein n=1 Tax=Lymnaea stagnalis TaxID=6523 RepID=A0AAV2H514_LYMST